jgi:hypothetical protein
MKEMKQFVVGGLDTPQKKQEAESILQRLGFKSDERFNGDGRRIDNDYLYIKTFPNNCDYVIFMCIDDEKPITLDDLRDMLPQPEPTQLDTDLLDMIAIAVMQSLINNIGLSYEAVARASYETAKQMLKVRNEIINK